MGVHRLYCEWTTLVVPSCDWFRSVVSFTRQVELQSTEALMPHMTDNRILAGSTREEDISLLLLNEAGIKMEGDSHLEICSQCRICNIKPSRII